jgi:hypothetical protein
VPFPSGCLLTSSQCFRYIVTDPPKPLSEEDIWFQIGHVHEQQKDVCCHKLEVFCFVH